MDKPRNIEFKGATDLVTDTDKASEDAILSVRSSLDVRVDLDDVQVPMVNYLMRGLRRCSEHHSQTMLY